jgi:hypothetical protein
VHKISYVLRDAILAGVCCMALLSHAQVTPGFTSPTNLMCGPAPCVFQNVQVSHGAFATNTNAVAVNPSNASEFVAAGYDNNCTGSRQNFYFSHDAGSTWHSRCVTTLIGDGTGNPIVSFNLHNILYAGGIQGYDSIYLLHSIDSGDHWSRSDQAVVDTQGIQWAWLAVDNSPDSQFQNDLYISYVHYPIYYGSDSQVNVAHSTVGGRGWTIAPVDQSQSYPASIDRFSHVSLGGDGTVYVTWMRCSGSVPIGDCSGIPASMMLSKSTNAGRTWSTPTTIATVALPPPTNICISRNGCLPNTNEPLSNIPVSVIEGIGSAAKVYVVFQNWTGSQLQVQLATSLDGGSTFSPPVRVTNSPLGDEFMPWISLSTNHTLGITWLDRRNDPSNISYQPYLTTSTDGITFRSARPLSPVLSDPNHDGSYGAYMGDYRTHVWVGDAIYGSWMDTRSGTSQLEIGGVQF